MSIPLLEVTPTSQNQRVEGYEVPDEDEPRIYRMRDVTSDTEINDLIWAYRQIFSEHLILEATGNRTLNPSCGIAPLLCVSLFGAWASRMSTGLVEKPTQLSQLTSALSGFWDALPMAKMSRLPGRL